MSFYSRIYPHGHASLHDHLHAADTFGGWDGRIITRVLPADISEREIAIIQAGGLHRFQHPDGYSQGGVPLFRLPDAIVAQAMRDLDHLALDRFETHNIPCNAGRTVMLNFIANAGGLTGVQYFAVGTGSGTPASSDAQLFTEVFRKIPTSTTISGNNVSINTTFNTGEGNYTYTEAGLFGDGATSSANSGQLFAHTLYSYTKTNTVQLNNQYQVSLN